MKIHAQLNRYARVALLAGVGLLAAAGVVFTQTAAAREQKSPDLKLKIDSQPIKRDAQIHASFAPVVKEVSPSVVSIATEIKGKEMDASSNPFTQNPLFREFFGERGPRGTFKTPDEHGLGSGVIVTEDGYILTNNHVVDGADEITVLLNPDGKRFNAKVVGRDPKSDVAVVKIDATGLPAIRLGNSDDVEVGDVVLAVGNPFGVGQSVTMGIVGATSREVVGRSAGLEYEDFIQTDAAINPGNSGGPLLDAQGRLIGINTLIFSRGGGNNGVGFAIPANLARNVMESIVEHGHVVRGYLGVDIQNLTSDLANEFGLKEPNGALVSDVRPRSPAEKAGIKSGDVITKFDGREVSDSRHLKLIVGQTPPDKSVTVALLRDGKPRNVDVVIKELPNDRELATTRRGNSPSIERGEDTGGLQGVVVGDITPQLRRQFEIPRNIDGALVTEIDEDSAAARAGLRQGDVIREINHHAVQDAESAIEAVQDKANAKILLRIWRDGGTLYLGVDESKDKYKGK